MSEIAIYEKEPHPYAFATAREEERLRRIWLGRGRAIKTLYPDPIARRRIYRTSLSPRSAVTLIARADAIRDTLVAGTNYAAFGTEDRLAFVGDVLQLLSEGTVIPNHHAAWSTERF